MRGDEAAASEGAGKAFACGSNSSGQCGVDSIEEVVRSPTEAQSVVKWAEVALGDSHACGISNDGSIYTWGLNDRGQCGINTANANTNTNTHGKSQAGACHGDNGDGGGGELASIGRPTRVGALDSFQAAVSVSCGFEHTCCVIDGGVVSWGSNEYGQCGTGDSRPAPSPGAGAGASTSSSHHRHHPAAASATRASAPPHSASKAPPPASSPAMRGGDRGEEPLSVWKPRPLRSLRFVRVVSVCCGHHHTLALTFQGSVYAWGSNSSGQLGLGDTYGRRQPEMIEALWATPVVALAAGSSHTLALTRQKMVLSWGRAKYGQLGLLLQNDDGTAATLLHGEEDDSQGGGAPPDSPSLKQTHSTRFCCVSPTVKRQKSNGGATSSTDLFHRQKYVNQSQLASLEDMGIEREQAISALEATNSQGVELAIEWIFSQQGAAGTSDRSIDDQGGRNRADGAAAMAAGGGDEEVLQVQREDVWTPRRIHGLSNVQSIACGTNHSVLCTSEGVYSFGYNRMGQLGLNCRENVPLPREIAQLRGKGIAKATCGTSHTIFLSKDGNVWGCGSADDGQLGPSINGTATIPERVDFAYCGACPHKDVVTGGYTTVFLQKSSDLRFHHTEIKKDLDKALAEFRSGGGVKAASKNNLKSLVESIFASPELMNIVFGKEEGFGIDVNRLEQVYKLILKCGIANQDIIPVFHTATNTLIRDLDNNSNLLTSPESIQVLLAVFQNPLLSQSKMAYTMNPKICKVVMNCISFSHKLLIKWWSEYPASILGGRIVRPIQDYVSTTLERECGHVSPSLVCTLNVLALLEESNQRSNLLPIEEFYNNLISEKMDVLQHYIVWRQNVSTGGRGFSFCNFPFLLNNEAKSNLLQTEARLTMHEMVQKSRMEQMFGGIFRLGDGGGAVAPSRKPEGGNGGNSDAASCSAPSPENCGVESHHPDACIIRIRRSRLIQDALAEIARQNHHDLHKPLKVTFIGEEGVDAGGVKKEFFQLLCETVMQPDYDLFVYQEESRTYWFNGQSLESEADFMLIGLVIGLAIYNSVILDVHFPLCLYKKLLGQNVGMKDLEVMQPEIARSLKKLLEWKGPGSVSDVFCFDFTIDQGSTFGEVKTFELKPGGASIPVTEENRHEYVDLYVDFLLNESIRTQFNAFKRGFLLLADGPVLRLFRPQELEVLVCGTPHLDFKALEGNAKYEGNYQADSKVVQWLWTVVNEMSLEDKRKFLKFFTGSDRAPIGGLGRLTTIVQRAGPDSDRLPTAHTCFNTLLLPEYGSRGKLRTLLHTAIQNAAGFGLE